jgi:hypothetical protein
MRRELVNWKEGVSYFLLMVLISAAFFFLEAGIYPPAFGVVLLVVLVSLGIFNILYWHRIARPRKGENEK